MIKLGILFYITQGYYQWLRTKNKVCELSLKELRWLLEGLSIYQSKARWAFIDMQAG
jgi:hypothetical protein